MTDRWEQLAELATSRADVGVPLADFVLQPYDPPSPASAESWSSAAVLLASAGDLDVARAFDALCVDLQGVFGASRIVYSVIARSGQVAWELYCYRRAPQREDASVEEFLRLLRRHVEIDDIESHSSLPLAGVVSVDLGPDQVLGRAPVESLNLYTGFEPLAVTGGLSYLLDRSGIHHHNIYCYYPRSQLDVARSVVGQSLHLGPAAEGLMGGTGPAGGVHYAVKAECDGLYLGGLTVDEMPELIGDEAGLRCVNDLLTAERSRLVHLRFDVGMDFTEQVLTKVAVFGTI